jgi:hypothetical protein
MCCREATIAHMPRLSLVRAASLALILVLIGAPSTSAATPVRVPGAPNCPVFPDTNVWNKPIDGLDPHPQSATLMATIGLNSYLHPDFSSISGGNYGIPYMVVGNGARKKNVKFTWPSESDPNPYFIPRNPKIEGGSDRHLLVVNRDTCRLYELFNLRKTSTGWKAGSGAQWDMRSNALRPDGWTSADAAGLPILPGLVRYDEVAAGEIRHALRFTTDETRKAYIYPARHHASDLTGAQYPPMGLRIRLKSTVNIDSFGPQSRVLLRALQVYGMILADNGSPLYVTGAPHANWDDDDLHDLHQIKGSDFEVVDTSGLFNG